MNMNEIEMEEFAAADVKVTVGVELDEYDYMTRAEFEEIMEKATDVLYYFLEGYMSRYGGSALVAYDGVNCFCAKDEDEDEEE